MQEEKGEAENTFKNQKTTKGNKQRKTKIIE